MYKIQDFVQMSEGSTTVAVERPIIFIYGSNYRNRGLKRWNPLRGAGLRRFFVGTFLFQKRGFSEQFCSVWGSGEWEPGEKVLSMMTKREKSNT